MSLKRNTIANYIGQFYLIIIGIVILPIYLHYLGSSAFGLIGLFGLLQSWLRLLDIGLSPTVSRQIAHACGSNSDFHDILKLLRSLEILFFIISILVVLLVCCSSNWISHHWLKIDSLSYRMVNICIMLMGLMIGTRWYSDLYSSGIQGLEYQVWLNLVNIVIATFQYVGGWVLIKWISVNPIAFFEYQFFVSILRLVIMGVSFYYLLPIVSKIGVHFSWEAIKKILPFALSIFYTAAIWIFVTQFGSLILSHILSLSDYGYFALVATISTGMLQISSPLMSAILPRMTRLLSANNKEAMLILYRNATQLMTVMMFSVSAVFVAFPTAVLYVWTGNIKAANWGGGILIWYILGNTILSVLGFQYYLQYAYGKLRLHVWINTIVAIIVIPAIYYAAYHYGAKGTAIAWFFIELISFFICPAIVHRIFAPGIHYSWLCKDIFPVFCSSILCGLCMRLIDTQFIKFSQIDGFLILGVYCLLTLIINSLVSPYCRGIVLSKLKFKGL